MREKLPRLALALTLVLGLGATAACDREDEKDIEEVGNEVEKNVDQLDTDGKDD
ncbi:MAG: hypothetical protein M3N53_14975 [Actinomycetota bacterium]|nr:hypothetical protein [Actinomycetota bacterium]